MEQQEIITAQAQADEAGDLEYCGTCRRGEKRAGRNGNVAKSYPHTSNAASTLSTSPTSEAGAEIDRVKVTERLQFEKPHLYVEVIKRPQYVVPGGPEQGVRSRPPPLAIVEGCKYDFSVVAAMGTLKFAFHVPTYRQQDWFAQYGWFPRRSTVNDLLNYAVETIGPLYRQMWLLLLSQPILLGDDTTLRVLLRDALSEDDLAKLSNRSRFRQATETRAADEHRPSWFGHQLRLVVHGPGRHSGPV